MALRDVTQTGLEIELAGTKYHMEPLTDQDHADLDSWVQSTYIGNAHRAAQDLPQAEYERVMSLAMRDALGLTWLFDPGRRVLRTIAGHAMVAYVGIRHRHLDAKYEDIRAAMLDARTLQYFKMIFSQVNNPAPETLKKTKKHKQNGEAANSSANPTQAGKTSTSGSPP